MDLATFRLSLREPEPPAALPPALQGLWWDAKGDWDRAHDLAQEREDAAGNWLHAYLHRKEGDLDNASYWYRRAGKPVAGGSLDAEWETIAAALLAAA